MAVGNEIKFGLNVNRSLADIVDNREALKNLDIEIADLDVIRNAAGDLGITSTDIRSLSGLTVPLPEYLTRLYNDTQQYSNIINQTAGTTETLKGNLTINGILAAGAIKFKYIDDDNTTIKVADISTSRISSWSSPDNPSNELSPIFYGSQVEVDGKVITPALELTEPADAVRFRDSEVPTHKIAAEINGSTIYFYAMKGIPLIFEGFFRNLDSDLRLISAGAVSWRIVNVQTSYLTREYENVGGKTTTRSYLRYRDTRAAEKNIEIYHNPNNIRTLPLPAAGIAYLPAAKLEGLTTLRLDRNVIKTFPNFKEFCPNATSIDVRENPFDLGEDPNLRKFNNNVMRNLPQEITTILMGNTFYGSVTARMRPGNGTVYTNSTDLLNGHTYIIAKLGTSDFTAAGAADNLEGTEFVATTSVSGTGRALDITSAEIISAPDIITFKTYRIETVGDTDFTLVGAASNTVGETFEATGIPEITAGPGTVKDVTIGLPKLITMNLNSHSRGGARAYFDRDTEDTTGSVPEVSDSVVNYEVYRNSFDNIPDSVKQLPSLKRFHCYANSITDANFYINSDDIEYVNIGSNTGINVPNLSNKLALRTFYAHYNRGLNLGDDNNYFVTPAGSYKFNNCSNVNTIYAYAAAYYGPIQPFAGNTALQTVEGRYSRLSGGKLINATAMEDGKDYTIFYNPDDNDDGNPDVDFTVVGAANSNQGTTFTADLSVNTITDATVKVIDREYVLHPGLFDDAGPTMRYFRISSSNLIDAPMHPETFDKCTGMLGIEVRSFSRGVSGEIPNLSTMTDLRYIVMLQNKLTGGIPTFFNNPRVYYAHLYGNFLSGTVPVIESTAFQYAYFHRNQLTGFIGLNTPNLLRLFLSFNLLTGALPDVSNLEKMYDFYINNNNLTDYTAGAIIGCRALRAFDISNNPNLPVGAVNQLVADLVANYENNPRGGVSVNLRNTATPTGEAVEQIDFLRAKGWNMRL